MAEIYDETVKFLKIVKRIGKFRVIINCRIVSYKTLLKLI